MAAARERPQWTAPAGTRWSFPLFGGYVCFVRRTDEAADADEADEAERQMCGLDEAIADVEAGRVSPAFDSVDDAIAWLNSDDDCEARDYSQYTPSLAEALREMDNGELDGPFTAEETIAQLHALCSR